MRIHFIGIGGIGTSALAKYYKYLGHSVSGSDLVFSEIISHLKKIGIKVLIGKHKKENISLKTDLVVYSPAVNDKNPEFKKAKDLKIKYLSYPQALGDLTKKHYTIAISGTHGKSTTTALISLILIKAGLDPTVIIGTKLKEFHDSNLRIGKSKYLIIEADEHFSSFLNYSPNIIVLLNIDRDHLDYYKNLSNILKAFKKYLNLLPLDGIIVSDKNDTNSRQVLKSVKRQARFFSQSQKEAKTIKQILKIPGKHNILNSLAALETARILGISDKISFKALSEYKGSWRRFEEHNIVVNDFKVKLISDYGHHPREIKTTLEAVREKYPNKEIYCVYQLHQYQRTYYFYKDFIKVFNDCLDKKDINKLILAKVYDVAGREEGFSKDINSKEMAKKIDQALYLPTFLQIKNYLKKNLKGGEVLVIMGAGNIYDLTSGLIKNN